MPPPQPACYDLDPEDQAAGMMEEAQLPAAPSLGMELRAFAADLRAWSEALRDLLIRYNKVSDALGLERQREQDDYERRQGELYGPDEFTDADRQAEVYNQRIE